MRLIDADMVLEIIKQYPIGTYSGVPVYDGDVLAIRDSIEDLPTIDSKSLRPRGTWEGSADGYADGELVYDTWTCSECGYTVDTDDPDDLTKFCPNCGAKMEGGHNP